MSELVSNSVRHAGAQPTGGLGLDVAFTPQSIRLEVRDLGRVFVPTERDTPLDPDWGLHFGAGAPLGRRAGPRKHLSLVEAGSRRRISSRGVGID
jgi:hypothetical protein